MTRTAAYAAISRALGTKYHTAETRTIAEVREAVQAAVSLRKELNKAALEQKP